MTQLSPSLRKAAVLISALDDDDAEALLQQMSADDAAKVRSALVELDEIPAEEQRHVLTEFLRRQGAAALPTPAGDGVALELDPAVEAAASALRHNNSAAAPHLQADEEPPFAFLEYVDPKPLAAVLCREHPQTVAVVVAHLPPQQAAAVLQGLPASLATDALERIAWLDELAPDIQTELIRELRRQLAPHIKSAQAGAGTLAHLAAVLEAMDHRQRQRAVRELGERNRTLVDRLGLVASTAAHFAGAETSVARYRLDSDSGAAPQLVSPEEPKTGAEELWLSFEELMLLSDAALRSVFAAADLEVVLLSLTGAEPRVISRLMRKMPPQEAAVLRRRLEHPGPVRLRDIEQARAALTAVASRLAHEGTITLPPSSRFAAAV